MSPDLFVRLASDEDFRAGVERAPRAVLAAQALTPLQLRLARLTAHRLERLALPQRSYLWWDSRESALLVSGLG